MTGITRQQRREKPDPHEDRHPVPRTVVALACAMSILGTLYIASSALETPASWGDDREPGELSGRGAGGSNAAQDGAMLYVARCAACHQADGGGLPGVFPPLAGSEWVTGKDGTALAIVLQGVSGEMRVAGKTYVGAMPGFKSQLDDAQVAAVVTHLRSSWGNRAAAVTPERVAEVRRALGERAHPFDGQKELESLP